ncbi:hypothetical protein DPMN_158666 [Dreissena polymorpha]|uniref:Uncharacterized protein n=1 Tax=Dreissena polymorpha TaxID=45954 RepID=A0A9D4IQ04_DREPO|nr:hypothetical protein DPMN_158666 [Dreissena polymorpha]
MTENKAAPKEQLTIIHCNFSVGCKSSRCSCRLYGLPCTPCTLVCSPCQTENCDNPNNSQKVVIEEEEDDNLRL